MTRGAAEQVSSASSPLSSFYVSIYVDSKVAGRISTATTLNRWSRKVMTLLSTRYDLKLPILS